MGYYSDVLIAVAAACKDDLQAIVAKAKIENPSGYEKAKPLLEKANVTTVEAGVFLWLKLTSVKWYDEFPEPQFFRTLLSAADSMGWPSLFISIGEDYDDTAYEMCEPFADDIPDERVAINDDLISAMHDTFSIVRQIECDANDKGTEPWQP